ncbi:uncharacterized protein SCHCODRAFT_02635644 [Schizophyllum commune H4-8]|nr:uncharacterized protein SCHCODRAFT_02635644 [Schizophyllum commune H4-8]KAI5889796.1 hypothetical protein SCHCODRAFT_02635644 [Schizophyllum commune H4-8]
MTPTFSYTRPQIVHPSPCDREVPVVDAASGHSLNPANLTTYLRSSYVPSDLDNTAIHGILPVMESDVAFYDDHIQRMEETLLNFRRRREETKTGIAQLRALVAPVRRLPNELLGMICTCSLPDDWFTADSGSRRFGFAQVCHAWREFALSEHWIWARISVGLRDSEKPPYVDGGWKEIVDTFLQRSGTHLLKLKVWPARDRALPPEKGFDAQAIWEIASENAYRLQALHIRFQTKPDVYHLPPALPVLTTLYVGRSYVGPNTADALPFRKIAPALTTLGVYRFPLWLLDVDWNNLRALIMPVSVADFEDTIPLLRKCGRLEHLEIGLDLIGGQDQMYIWNDGSDVELPFLRKLETVGSGLRLLPFFNAPLLNVIYADLLLDPFSAPGNRALAREGRTHPAVEFLTFKDITGIGSDLSPLVRGFPLVRSLRTVQTSYGWPIRPELLKALEVSETGPVLLPSLVELDIEASKPNSERWNRRWHEEVIERAVGSRVRIPAGVSAPKLQRLRVWIPDATFTDAFIDFLLGLQDDGVKVAFMDKRQIFNTP